MPRNARIVAGHGPDFPRGDLLADEKMVRSSLETVRDAMSDGMDIERMKKEGILDDWSEYADGFFDLDFWIEIFYHCLDDQ
jgi:hypothetical protein